MYYIIVVLKDGTVMTFDKLCNFFNFDDDKFCRFFIDKYGFESRHFLAAIPYDNILYIKNEKLSKEELND